MYRYGFDSSTKGSIVASVGHVIGSQIIIVDVEYLPSFDSWKRKLGWNRTESLYKNCFYKVLIERMNEFFTHWCIDALTFDKKGLCIRSS